MEQYKQRNFIDVINSQLDEDHGIEYDYGCKCKLQTITACSIYCIKHEAEASKKQKVIKKVKLKDEHN